MLLTASIQLYEWRSVGHHIPVPQTETTCTAAHPPTVATMRLRAQAAQVAKADNNIIWHHRDPGSKEAVHTRLPCP